MTESEVATGMLSEPRASRTGVKRRSLAGLMLIACVCGAGLISLTGCHSMSARTDRVFACKYDGIDQACEAIRTFIESQGLSYVATRNLNKSMAKHGVHLDRQVRVIEFCRADYAQHMLRHNPEICTLLPCTFGVYEGDDGHIYISTMNQRIMGDMFGGTVARVINEQVAQDEARVLDVHVR